MNYTIKTPSANRLKKEILNRVSEKADANGKGIATWQCVETDTNEVVLVHTKDQWEEKGCLKLTPTIAGNDLQVRFHYWSSFDENNKCNDDEKYLLGRFTELILVHFFYYIDKVVIE